MNYNLLVCAADKQWTAIDVNADGDCDRISIEGNQAMSVESNEAVSEFCVQILNYYNIEKFSDIELNIKIVVISEYSCLIENLFLQMNGAKSINIIDAKSIIPVYVLKKCIVKPDSVIDVRCFEKKFTLQVDNDLLVSYTDGKAGEEIVMEPEDFSILFRFDCRNLISDESELKRQKKIYSDLKKKYDDLDDCYIQLKKKYDEEMNKFSVGKGKKVHFSKGNLYYDGRAFKFEDNQYSSADSWNVNHVSHFYWSKDARVAYAEVYEDANSKYGIKPSFGDVFFTNETKETANPNFTVNGEKGKYRTLSEDEWRYLLNIDNETTKYRQDANRFAKAKVNGVKGLLIFPDGYTLPSGYTVGGGKGMTAVNEAGSTDSPLAFPTKSIPDEIWTTMESVGVVFLPAAGYRNGSDVDYVGSDDGYYWSAAAYDSSFAYFLDFHSSGAYMSSYYRYYGQSVRLVCGEN